MNVNILLLNLIFYSHCFSLTNWAGNQGFKPFKFVEPTNLHELTQLVQQAKNEGKTIRAFGSRHSWSDVAASDGYMLKTDKLNRVLMINKDTQRVRVEAGIKVKDLVKILDEHGLALPNQPAILEQSIAGMMSTGTHGTGHTGTIARFVKEVELIAGDGTLHVMNKKTHPTWYPAVRVSMGSLGIIYAVTLQCVPAFNLTYQTYRTTWDEVKDHVMDLHEHNDHFQCFLDPYSQRVVVELWNRTKQETEGLWGRFKKSVRDGSTYLSTKLSRLFPSTNRFFVNLWTRSNQEITETIESYKTLSGNASVFYLEEEIAVEEMKLFPALGALLQLIKQYEEKNILISGILLRFVAAEKRNLLSPASGRNSVYISITTPVNNDYWSFFEDVQKTLIPFGGRPHWGKINFLTNQLAGDLYRTDLDRFIEIRRELDPDGLFSNSFTKRIFGW